ncbi:hypothetical protein K239x_57200 [Planctomycetes bacterium K23_9]|uniref:Uncharacterized protein n=1 Tax=Stieleria marina TaxID=1930275 RepID=A0A517P2U6_9BACT|nr:hypothetical protein K239x_57200 [Planctomycetes bacterium K23_9]
MQKARRGRCEPEVRIDMASRFFSSSSLAMSEFDLVGTNSCSNFLELSVCVGTDSTDSCQANDDDQSKHDGVFNCSWAIFFFKKCNDAVCEVFHLYSHISVSASLRRSQHSAMLKGPIQHEWVPKKWGPASSSDITRTLERFHQKQALDWIVSLGSSAFLRQPTLVGCPRTRNFASRLLKRFAFVWEVQAD